MKAMMKNKVVMLGVLIMLNALLALAPLARADAGESSAEDFDKCKWMYGESGNCYQGCGDNWGGCGGSSCDSGPAGCPET